MFLHVYISGSYNNIIVVSVSDTSLCISCKDGRATNLNIEELGGPCRLVAFRTHLLYIYVSISPLYLCLHISFISVSPYLFYICVSTYPLCLCLHISFMSLSPHLLYVCVSISPLYLCLHVSVISVSMALYQFTLNENFFD